MRLVLTVAILALCIVSAHSSERWTGTRVSQASKSNGIICSRTKIKVRTSGNKISATQTYNGSRLSGQIKSNGSFTMTGSISRFSYTFTGSIKGAKMSGTWSEKTSGCRGSWSATKN